jgi:hypothetical protein
VATPANSGLPRLACAEGTRKPMRGARRKARVSLVVRECGQIRLRHVAHLRKKTHCSA